MSLDRSWQNDWAETWLSDPAYVSTLDHWVRRRHVQHHEAAERQAAYGTVGPWTVAGLVSDVHRHAIASHWLWATTAICFLQELVFCIDDGGVDMSRHLSDDFIDEVKTLRYLRNVVAHPAKMPVKTGENSVDQLCFRMEREPQFWSFAPELLDNWSLFADHRVTRFALRRINTAGRAYGRQLGLLPQR
ncbi:MAG TPA: hypothetical protein VFK02_02960 [Kofleriaceae bacterium]|nr:hypothetical protein [Kofleriaceae bacterium]